MHASMPDGVSSKCWVAGVCVVVAEQVPGCGVPCLPCCWSFEPLIGPSGRSRSVKM
jgi:hypothetical protein